METNKPVHIGIKKFLLPFLRNGSKTLEVRSKNEFTEGIRIGDYLVFNDEIVKVVRDIRGYHTFEEALQTEPADRIWPNMSAGKIIEALNGIYRAHGNFYGVLVFELADPPPHEPEAP